MIARLAGSMIGSGVTWDHAKTQRVSFYSPTSWR
jgi:hypothetical protein